MLTAVAVLTLAGCGANDDRTPSGDVTEGTVNLVQDAGDPLVFVLSTKPQSNLNNAIITVSERNLEGASPKQVQRGDKVKVWVEKCTSSIPAQCEATRVEVME